MLRIALKILISAVVITAVSEIGKRSTLVAAILASLPLTSLLAITWLYVDTGDTNQVIDLSKGIFWAVLPSLLFFVLLPLFLRAGMRFPLAMVLASGSMAIAYAGYGWLLGRLGVAI
jgi:hypothetical protein